MKRRNTKHKERILVLFERRHLLSAADIMNCLPEVDQSVVYRNLQRFEEDGVVKKVELSSGEFIFERTNHVPHEHFLCRVCRKVFAIDMPKHMVEKFLPKNLCLLVEDVVLQGTCGRCKTINS